MVIHVITCYVISGVDSSLDQPLENSNGEVD